MGMVLDSTILIHNFWTEFVGLNQISEVFNSKYEHVINIHGYNWIQRYFLKPGDYETNNEAKLMEEDFGGESNSK